MNQKEIETLSNRLIHIMGKLPDLKDVGKSPAIQGNASAIQESAAAMAEHFAVGDPVAALAALDRICRCADGIAGRIKDAMDSADKEGRERGQELYRKASSLMFRLNDEITERRNLLRHRDRQTEQEEQRLRGAGLSQEQIAKLSTDWTPEARQAIEAEIANLECEKEALGAFCADGPRFDPALLPGTRIDPAREAAALADAA